MTEDCQKINFYSKEEALDYLNYLKKQPSTRRSFKSCNVYECSICGEWHLTSQKSQKKRRRSIRRYNKKQRELKHQADEKLRREVLQDLENINDEKRRE